MNAFSFVLLVGVCVGATGAVRVAYEPGACDTSISSVIKTVVMNEVRALFNPQIRYSGTKRIQYDLYTPHNPYERHILRPGDVHALRNSFFSPQWPVKFSIHGWAGKSTSCSNAAIKDAYLGRGNFNVILMDWSETAHDISYDRISQQLSDIAASFVKFVRFLHRETGVRYEDMYLIGHSAGSHISGLAGKLLKPQRFGGIVALDPAGLAQLGLPATRRLAPDDAPYVESIHSDISHLGNPSTELSNASFFPNWGQGQPHCPNATAAEFDFACDHFAALYYFAESIRDSKMFGALRCRSNGVGAHSIANSDCTCDNGLEQCAATVFMGGEPVTPKSGVYYFSTKPKAPYGRGEWVQVQPVQPSKFLESSVLTQRLVQGVHFSRKSIYSKHLYHS